MRVLRPKDLSEVEQIYWRWAEDAGGFTKEVVNTLLYRLQQAREEARCVVCGSLLSERALCGKGLK